jgi:preprotein translocase subunit SecG
VSILLYTVITLTVAISLVLMLLILIQKGRGGGLSSAFGGVGGHTAFGSKTGDVLTWATAIVFFVFLLLSIVAGLTFEKVNNQMKRAPVATPMLPASNSGTPSPAVPANGAPESNAPEDNAPAPASGSNSSPITPPTTAPAR